MRLEWSRFALADRTDIFDYVEADSPRAAAALDDRIREQIDLLARFPESGRSGRITGTRELVIVGTPYIAAYRVMEHRVRMLRILHGARRWPDELPD